MPPMVFLCLSVPKSPVKFISSAISRIMLSFSRTSKRKTSREANRKYEQKKNKMREKQMGLKKNSRTPVFIRLWLGLPRCAIFFGAWSPRPFGVHFVNKNRKYWLNTSKTDIPCSKRLIFCWGWDRFDSAKANIFIDLGEIKNSISSPSHLSSSELISHSSLFFKYYK